MNVDLLCSLVTEAGRAIFDAIGGEKKEGLSSFDQASGLANRIIVEGLHSCCPDVPVFSKEDTDVSGGSGEELARFFLVDPLDGAGAGKSDSGEFTVNVALIEGGVPVLGAVYVPVRQTLYFASRGEGCWKVQNGAREQLRVSAPAAGAPTRVVVGRSQISPDTVSLIDLLPGSSATIGRDSALKFCAIAEGEADFYPQLECTREWETAAGQILVTEAGGIVTDFHGTPHTYNKTGLVNGPFFVAPSLAWLQTMDLLDCQKRLAEREFEYLATSCR
ncbi:MAG: 3'(2'),5'-bisphosphate nucleotidase CysQ family protein [Syntrophobacteraceae bacterium]